MTDERRRELERKFRATGDLGDEVRWLLELQHSGTLDDSKLALAAYAGSKAARTVLGDEAPKEIADLWRWGQGFEKWGVEACVRAGLAAIAPLLPAVLTFERARPAFVRWLRLAWECATSPSERHALELEDLYERGAGSPGDPSWFQVASRPGRLELLTEGQRRARIPAACVAWVVESLVHPERDAQALVDAAQAAARTVEAAACAWEALEGKPDAKLLVEDGDAQLEARATQGPRVRESVRGFVAEWALGRGDPLAEAITRAIAP